MRHAGILAFMISAAIAVPGTAAADKPPKGDKGRGHKDDQVRVTVTFAPDEREKVRLFFVETYGRGKCPPGLAKKRNGCLPPGQAKKRYRVGRPLPPDIEIRPLPPDLTVRIGAPPDGYRYAIVDGDLVKLVVGTLLVIDAIQGLSE